LSIPQVSARMNVTLRWTLYSYMYFHIHYIHIHFTSKPPLCRVLLSSTLIPTGPAQPSSLCFPASLLLTKPKLLSPRYLNIPAYHVALDGFVLRSICVECLTKHSRIEEAIYNCGRKPRISQNETYGRGVLWVERSSDGE
jgi:hypothetical protein